MNRSLSSTSRSHVNKLVSNFQIPGKFLIGYPVWPMRTGQNSVQCTMRERSCHLSSVFDSNSIYYLISMLTISRYLSTCSAPQHLFSTLSPTRHLGTFSAPLCFLSTISVLSGFLGTFVSNLVLRCCTYPLGNYFIGIDSLFSRKILEQHWIFQEFNF